MVFRRASEIQQNCGTQIPSSTQEPCEKNSDQMAENTENAVASNLRLCTKLNNSSEVKNKNSLVISFLTNMALLQDDDDDYQQIVEL